MTDTSQNGDDSQMSVKAEQRTQLVRKAFKFVNQECADEDQARMAKLFNVTWQVAQICQALCHRQAATGPTSTKRASTAMDAKYGLSKSASIGITDYGRSSNCGASNAPTPPLVPVMVTKGCQTAAYTLANTSNMETQKSLAREDSKAEMSLAYAGEACQLLE